MNIHERLDMVRHEAGIGSLVEFRRRLMDAGARVSYGAVRNYHLVRQPPVRYLLQVLTAFPDVDPGWLLTGTLLPAHGEPRPGIDVRMRWALKYSEGSPSMREPGAATPGPGHPNRGGT